METLTENDIVLLEIGCLEETSLLDTLRATRHVIVNIVQPSELYVIKNIRLAGETFVLYCGYWDRKSQQWDSSIPETIVVISKTDLVRLVRSHLAFFRDYTIQCGYHNSNQAYE